MARRLEGNRIKGLAFGTSQVHHIKLGSCVEALNMTGMAQSVASKFSLSFCQSSTARLTQDAPKTSQNPKIGINMLSKVYMGPSASDRD